MPLEKSHHQVGKCMLTLAHGSSLVERLQHRDPACAMYIVNPNATTTGRINAEVHTSARAKGNVEQVLHRALRPKDLLDMH
jgi:inosine-uridine nucleoside N-ribohydrolase